MKDKLSIVVYTVSAALAGLGLAALLSGCGTFGANPSPPNKVEKMLFDTTTNYVPVVIPAYVTNRIDVTSYQTNVQGVLVTQYLTNVVPVTVPAVLTNVPSYTETPKESVKTGIQAGGGVLNTFFPGIGSIAANVLLALIGGYGYFRSAKNANTGAVLAQNVELARQLLQSLPNGTALDNAFVTFIQNHQAEEGVINNVISLIGSKVSNNDAQVAAQQITQAIAALNTATAPATPAAAPKA